tara:strand:- start:48 stop:410 length:363 start_codon:yes stop_codon:yes gene_type:complete
MFNWLSKIGFGAVIIANWRLLLKITFIIICYFISESIFSRWLDPTLGFERNTRLVILSINTIFTIFLFVWLLLSLKNILWINRSKRAIDVDKSFTNQPNEYSALEDVNLTPSLKDNKQND